MSNYQWQPPRQQEPAWIDGSTAQSVEQVRDFLRGVYAWMFGGLALTALSSLLVLRSPALQQMVFGNRAMPWILFAVEFGLVIWLQMRITKMSAAAAASVFLFYSFLNGLTFSVIFLLYTASSIFQAFATAAVLFGSMSIYGMVTKRDLTSWGTFLIMGMWGVFISLMLNIWLKSSMLSFIVSVIGVIVFTGLTAYDTQKLKAFALSPTHRGNLAVYGALMLYLDFINLFLMLLRLFGGRRD